jgi:hypothetical protein
MPELEIPFRQWLPDQPDLNNPGLVEAKNVYRLNGAYQPQTDIEFPGGDMSDDLTLSDSTDIIGGGSFSGASGVPSYCFRYGDSGLLAIEPQASASPNVLNIGSQGQPSSDFVNFNGSVYYHARGSAQYKSTNGAAFAATSATTQFGATSAARVNNFIMTGFLDEIKWSGFNLPEDWTISEVTQAGEAEVNRPELGEITGIQGGVVNYIFQEFGVSRLTYVGPPKVWDVRTISYRYGALKNTHVEVNGITYFMGVTGSHSQTGRRSGNLYIARTNGQSVEDIGSGIVNDWLNENFSAPVLLGSNRNVVFDHPRRRIIWSSAVGDDTHKFLCMNIDTQEFSYFEGEYHFLIPGPYHHEDNGGSLVAIAPNSGTLYYGPMTGDTLEATLTTGHIANAGERAFVDEVEPQYVGSGATVALSAKERLRDAGSFSAYAAEESSTGIADVRADGRAIALSVKFPAGEDWSDLSGVVVDASRAGKR